MRCAMRKPLSLLFMRFSAQLMEPKNDITLFTGSNVANNMPPENLNEILLHTGPNGWENKYYLQEWDFKGGIYKETCEVFEQI